MLDWIISLYSFFASLAIRAYRAAAYFSGQWWAPEGLVVVFNEIGDLFNSIFNALVQFWYWASGLESRIAQFLSWDSIQNWLSYPLYQLSQIWVWFIDRVNGITAVINTWWTGAQTTVKAWIEVAKQSLNTLIATAQKLATDVGVAWDNFRLNTLPSLLSFNWFTDFWGGLYGSIKDWWEPKYQDIKDFFSVSLQPLVDKVSQHDSWFDIIKDFFDDPLEWLWKRFTDWFLGVQ